MKQLFKEALILTLKLNVMKKTHVIVMFLKFYKYYWIAIKADIGTLESLRFTLFCQKS